MSKNNQKNKKEEQMLNNGWFNLSDCLHEQEEFLDKWVLPFGEKYKNALRRIINSFMSTVVQ